MDDMFRERVQAAAAAAWWALLAGAAFFVVQWIGYRFAMSAKPAWMLAAWGPDATWDSVRAVWFGALVFMKLSLWPLALAALWLTLWARRLSGRGPRA